MQAMKLPPGFTVDLVASEPDLVHPVAMAFDERGRIWVIDSGPGPTGCPGPHCMKVLESTRGDGAFDHIWTATNQLRMASAIAVGHGGVWVVDAPELLYFPYDAATGSLGPHQVVVSGFGQQNSNGLPNSLTWGPDGWLYGLSSVWSPSSIRHQGKAHRFSCGVFRVQPRTREFEVFAEGTSNPWGIAWDGEGAAFISTCVTDHLWQVTETAHYHRISGASPPFAWELGSIVTHKHDGHSHCGLEYFDSDAYPPAYRERLFMGNVSRGRINIDLLERTGVSYRSLPAPDFLQCADPWFVPVALKSGPDGCLYVLDWSDPRHCDEDLLRRRRSSSQPSGRLYRIRHGNTPGAGSFDLGREGDAQLVERLASPNQYFRNTAQQLLATRPAARPGLQELALSTTTPRKTRLHALWALIGSGLLETEFHEQLLGHPDGTFRAWAVRAAGNMRAVTPAVRARVRDLAKDREQVVQLQVTIAARKIADLDPLPIFAEVAAAPGDDPLIAAIIWTNLLPLLKQRAGEFLELVQRQAPASPRLALLLPRLTDYLAARGGPSPTELLALLQKAKGAGQLESPLARQTLAALADKIQTGEIAGTASAAVSDWATRELQPLLEERRALPVEAVCLLATLRNPAAFPRCRQELTAANQSDYLRVQTCSALIAGNDPQLLDTVDRLLMTRTGSSEVRGRILAVLGRCPLERVAEVMLARYADMEADLQPVAIGVLVQRRTWARRLLTAIQQDRVPAGALNAAQLRQLLASKDGEVIELAKTIWGNVRPEGDASRTAVVSRMKTLLASKPGDPVAGQQVFGKLCGQCHRIHGSGADVGPDLTVAGRTSFDQLVSKVFDPNQFIKSGYQAVTAGTTGGRFVTGLVVEDSPQRLVLKTQGGKLETLPRSEVEEVIVSRQSLMPEGIEQQLPHAELIDLFAFLALDRPPGDPQARKIPGVPSPR